MNQLLLIIGVLFVLAGCSKEPAVVTYTPTDEKNGTDVNATKYPKHLLDSNGNFLGEGVDVLGRDEDQPK